MPFEVVGSKVESWLSILADYEYLIQGENQGHIYYPDYEISKPQDARK